MHLWNTWLLLTLTWLYHTRSLLGMFYTADNFNGGWRSSAPWKIRCSGENWTVRNLGGKSKFQSSDLKMLICVHMDPQSQTPTWGTFSEEFRERFLTRLSFIQVHPVCSHWSINRCLGTHLYYHMPHAHTLWKVSWSSALETKSCLWTPPIIGNMGLVVITETSRLILIVILTVGKQVKVHKILQEPGTMNVDVRGMKRRQKN